VAPTLIQLPGPIVSQEDASLGHQAVAVRFDRKLTECLSYAVIEILLGTERLPMNPALSQPGCPSGSLTLRACRDGSDYRAGVDCTVTCDTLPYPSVCNVAAMACRDAPDAFNSRIRNCRCCSGTG